MKIIAPLAVLVFMTMGCFSLMHDHIVHDHADDVHSGCITVDPPEEDVAKFNTAIMRYKFGRSNGFGTLRTIIVPVNFVIFQPSDGRVSEMGKNVVDEQMKVLNEGFFLTPFQFELKDTKYVINDVFYKDFLSPDETGTNTLQNSVAISTLYRRGGADTLNVYFGNKVSLGSFATYPRTLYSGESPYSIDGAFIDINTVPGGPFSCCNLGKTLVHEVGHWLGLMHTFAGDSCDPTNVNDHVHDTPQQAGASNVNCQVGRDSCPGLPGFDPIHNFMDYSKDECLTEFTPGQTERMYVLWSLFRQSNEVCNPGHILFRFEINLDLFPRETSWALKGSALDIKNTAFGNTDSQMIDFNDANRAHVHDICLPVGGDYVFTIFDEGGNGLKAAGFPAGSYKLYLKNVLIKEGSAFKFSESTSFSTASVIPSLLAPPTVNPTLVPTSHPTLAPTMIPSRGPTNPPSTLPTLLPTLMPTSNPTLKPTITPTPGPTSPPSPLPTLVPTTQPTLLPTMVPSRGSTNPPSTLPTSGPSLGPNPVSKNVRIKDGAAFTISGSTSFSSASVTSNPLTPPTTNPTPVPTSQPTLTATPNQTPGPTSPPSLIPTMVPTVDLTLKPTSLPTNSPTFSEPFTETHLPLISAALTTSDVPIPTASSTNALSLIESPVASPASWPVAGSPVSFSDSTETSVVSAPLTRAPVNPVLNYWATESFRGSPVASPAASPITLAPITPSPIQWRSPIAAEPQQLVSAPVLFPAASGSLEECSESASASFSIEGVGQRPCFWLSIVEAWAKMVCRPGQPAWQSCAISCKRCSGD